MWMGRAFQLLARQVLRDEDILQPGAYVSEPGYVQGQSAYLNAGEHQKLLYWHSPREDDGHSHSLVLSAADAPLPSETGNLVPDPDVYGVIQFGRSGAEAIVEVDWLNGTQLTLPAGSGTLTAVYPTADESWRMYLGAFTLADQRPPMGSVVARRSRRVPPVPVSSTSARIGLPALATSVSLFLLDAGYGAVQLGFSRVGAENTNPTATNIGARIVPGDATPIAIPGGTRSIYVTNLSPTLVANATLVFGLAL